MTDCPRQGRWFGCKFEPRYDLGAAGAGGNIQSLRASAAGLEKFRAKTYVRDDDVCVRCGRALERTAEKGSI